MNNTDDQKGRAAGLRQRAEEIARANATRLPADPRPQSSEEMRQILRNLQVHQIELDLLNEELRRTQVELDAARARYFDLYDLAPVGYLTVSESGLILESNLTAATLLGLSRAALMQQQLSRFIFKEDQDLHYRHRRQLIDTGEPQSYDLRLLGQGGKPFWVALTAARAQLGDGAAAHRVVISDITKRRRAIEALQDSDAALQKAQAVAHVGSWKWHIRENRLEWSAEMFRIFGIEKEEFAGDLADVVARAIHPDDRAAVEQANLSVIRDGKPVPLEYRVLLSDGTTRVVWAEAGELVRDKAGNPAVLTGIVQDITDRKKVHQRLAESEQLTAGAMAAMPDGIVMHRNGKIEYVNPSLLRILGLEDTGAMIGRQMIEYMPVAFHDIVVASFVRAPSGAPTPPTEVQVIRGDGSVLDVEVSGASLRKGDALRIVVIRDISARKRSGMELRKLSLAVEQSPSSIVITDRAGTIEYVNPRFEKVSGYTKAEAVGKNPRILKSGIVPDYVYAQLWTTISGGGEWRGELCNRRRNGEEYWEAVAISGVKGDSGGIEHYVALKEDITERKRMEQVHLQAQKLESLGTLAGGIAHDFNNILAAIRGNSDLALVDVGPDHLAAESLEEIRKASDRASELVRRIKAFGRPKEFRPDVVDLSAVVGEVLKLLRATLPAGILLRREFAEDAPHILADAGQIHEAIVNLTTNAAYAIGPRAGSIVYRLELTEMDDQLARSIAGLQPGRYACLTVSDSGCGMDAATIERIFDAFYSTKPAGEGTGLGLSMVHGTMRSHNGAVTVESVPGAGSRFALYFPAAPSQAQDKEQSAPAQIIHCAGKRVLYVDDEEALVLLAKRVFTRLGHSIAGFTDPMQALEAFRAHPQDFDLAVTDLSMPHMSGFDLAREVLALRPEMPVLMTTGYIEHADEQAAHLAGIREIILKPVAVDTLGQTIDRLFQTTPQYGPPDASPDKDGTGRT